MLECQEQGPLDIRLSDVLDESGLFDLNPEIRDGDYFAVSLRRGVLTLRARGHVGHIPLNERIIVFVRPRVPINNLTRLVRISEQPPTALTSLRDYAIGDRWSESLIDLYAAALVNSINEIISAGLLRDYQSREAVSSFPHGRVLLGRTIASLHPRAVKHAAHIRWFERSVDNACNQCLKYAVWWLAQQYIGRRSELRAEARRLHRQLNALYPTFEGVSLDHSRRFVDDPVVTGARPLPTLRAYYRDALNVALAAISQQAVLLDGSSGDLRLPSLIINMNDIFEGYLRNILSSFALEHVWPVQVLDGNRSGKKPLFSDAPSPDATPDIVINEPDGTTKLVIEIKNIPGESQREAINQAVTYAVSYHTNNVVLVYPRASLGQSCGLRLMGHIGGIAVYQYRFDLNATDLVAEDAEFGGAIGRLLGL